MTTEGRHTERPCLPMTISMTVLVKALLLLIFCPAFISCTEKYAPATEESGVPDDNGFTPKKILLLQSPLSSGTLDIFCFRNDRLRRLDSYQRIGSASGRTVEVASGSGDMTVSLIANSHLSLEDCGRVLSYDDLLSLHSELSADSPSSPVMTGECSVGAGTDRACLMTLEPLLTLIRVNSICCDLHTRPYKESTLKNVSVYLTNVCGRYPLFGQPPESPASVLNYGKLTEEDSSGFAEPSMLCYGKPIPEIGTSAVFPDIRLYCYPNICSEESLGSPFTRLVIEGELDGRKTYYPIDINRTSDYDSRAAASGGGQGVQRNCTYSFDITITRSGVPSPDIPIDPADIRCSIAVTPWKTTADRVIPY